MNKEVRSYDKEQISIWEYLLVLDDFIMLTSNPYVSLGEGMSANKKTERNNIRLLSHIIATVYATEIETL